VFEGGGEVGENYQRTLGGDAKDEREN
jgi:hypothetical protein